MKYMIAISCILGFSSVVLGAAGDHILTGMDLAMTKRFDTGLRYHQLYSVVALMLSLFAEIRPQSYKGLKASALLFLLGIFIFSGSLYLSIVLQNDWLTYGTPLGGLMLMAGWLSLGLSSLKKTKAPKGL